MNVCILHLKYEYIVWSENRLAILLLLRHVVPVVKRRCAGDVLPDTFNIDGFKSIKNNSSTIKHIYIESAKIIEGCNVAFHINDCWIYP